ncbi:adenosylcobalamin-dependent ribonucleoside-diphosphate reductase (plasmid) [Halorarum halophilum]|uniref:Vitamin B12-dependent ribonucleotide reductase n=1 Tax=Halorarum halophilum TaxID=2743090 RepID=A0A7D5GQ75_9EURY|nr:adenosylcobalamin-dependent ribonucleoside-diphosphate reductase [Halobaculum halophilum]QLG30164.1 adenosylcobalamin-dependent ribonucleoside-diphosphate reductase [Halobaculum halophilum]
MSKPDMSVRLPKKRTNGATLADNLTENAYDRIIPPRYLKKDADGNLLEETEDLFERVAKNIAVAEAVYTADDVQIQPKHIKPDHPRRADIVDDVFGCGDGCPLDESVPLTEENAKWVDYDALIDGLPDATTKVVEGMQTQFQILMEQLDFVPNSPTLANAGDELQQLSACFVMSPQDDLDDIHNTLTDAALTFQSGGGVGYAFSYLRPYGDTVGSTGGIASGPLTFMRTYDQMCQTIAQGGMRRGAQMGVMRVTHPDVIFFIHSKNKDVSLAQALRLDDPKDYTNTSYGEALAEARQILDRFTTDDGQIDPHLRNAVEAQLANFNISVTVTDEFMEAVKNDDIHTFINPRTGEPHIATAETEEMYGWFDLDEYVTVGEPLAIPAREIWEDIIEGAHENGEPGVLFIDAANHDHSFPTESTPTWNGDADPFEMSTTNPCGEQWLMENEACNLGHINLSTIVDEDALDWREWVDDEYPFGMSDDAEELRLAIRDFLDDAIDWGELNSRVELGTRFLDNVVTMSAFPTPEIEETVRKNRKIGLGVMGLAQLFVQLGTKYGSDTSNEVTRQVMRHINQRSKKASRDLARDRGAFENWRHSKYADVANHADWFERQTGESAGDWYDEGGYPIRNHNTTTIAPTGTTGMIGNTSGGCEPIYQVAYKKNVSQDIQGDEQLVEFDDYFLRVLEANDIDVEAAKQEALDQMNANEFEGVQSLETVPDAIGELFVTTDMLTGKEHAAIQCAAQEGVDSAISKTVNFPNDATREDVAEVYEYLWENGAKGGTVYRDGSRSKQVLSTRADHGMGADTSDLSREEAEELIDEIADEHGIPLVPSTVNADGEAVAEPRDPGKVLEARRERIKTGYGQMYVNIGFDEEGRPVETICNIGKSGGFTNSMVEAIGKLSSLALQAGVPAEEVIEKLDGISSPDIAFDDGEQIASLPDGIAAALQRAIESRQDATLQINAYDDHNPNDQSCADCGAAVVMIGGCPACAEECGWSKCG